MKALTQQLAKLLKPGLTSLLLTGTLASQSPFLTGTAYQAQAISPPVSDPTLTQGRSLPPSVRQKVLKRVSQDTKIPINKLKLVAARPQTWDGCLGVAGPMQPCTMIAIFGWQVIVTGPQQYWVYHLDERGSQIKQNPTTSGKGTIVPGFWQAGPDNPQPAMGNDVLFQSVATGGFAGTGYKLALLKNGQLMRTELRGKALFPPKLVRQLSAQEMQKFTQVLQQNELEDFLGFNYPTSRGADYFTVSLMVPYGRPIVQYADIIQDQTPAKLQQIIQAWDQLSRPTQKP